MVLQKKKVGFVNKKSKQFKIFVLLAVVVFVGYIGWSLYAQEVSLQAKTNQLETLKEDIKVEEAKKAKYERERMNINTPEYIERVAREKLGMIKPNEKIYVDPEK